MKGKWKRASDWCPNCDRTYVAIGKKCTECNVRFEGKKLSKPTKKELLNEINYEKLAW